MGNYIFNKAKKSSKSTETESSDKEVIDTNKDTRASKSSSTKSNKQSNKPDSKMTAPIIIQPTIKQTATLIFLHGLGDTGYLLY